MGGQYRSATSAAATSASSATAAAATASTSISASTTSVICPAGAAPLAGLARRGAIADTGETAASPGIITSRWPGSISGIGPAAIILPCLGRLGIAAAVVLPGDVLIRVGNTAPVIHVVVPGTVVDIGAIEGVVVIHVDVDAAAVVPIDTSPDGHADE